MKAKTAAAEPRLTHDKYLLEKVDAKADIKDVCALVDTKADSDAVFEVLDEMKKSLSLIGSKVEDQS